MQFRWIITALLAGTALFSEEPTGPQIIRKVNRLMHPETSRAKSKMIIQTSTGQERAFVYESWSMGHGEKHLIRYLEPRRIKSQATLLTNFADDIWMYFPRTQRVRKLAAHAKKQKMEGSDFSYEDMGSGNGFIKYFTSTRKEDETIDDVDCYQVEMIKNENTDVSYSRMIMFVGKNNFVPIRIEYFDEDDSDRLLKVLTQSDIEVIDGIPTGMKMVMQNASDNTQTRMEFLEVKFNLPVDANLFTERGLKR